MPKRKFDEVEVGSGDISTDDVINGDITHNDVTKYKVQNGDITHSEEKSCNSSILNGSVINGDITNSDVTNSDITNGNIVNGGISHKENAQETDDSCRNSAIPDKPREEITSTETEPVNAPKKKRGVKFNGVTVYYFPRSQGFTCVPSQGGSTLGMGDNHVTVENFSLKEYSQSQRQLHKRILQEQKLQGKLLHTSLLTSSILAQSALEEETIAAEAEIESSPEENNSKAKDTADDVSEKDSDDNMERDEDDSCSDSSSDESDDDLNVDDYYFLTPVPTRQRRVLLRTAGIKKIDSSEKEECKDIRISRESCGCDCKGFCDPETCLCALSGIKCQVDRLSFPCGCTKDGCGNLKGRIEFNPIRVRTHFIHTLMRLELEKKQRESQEIRRRNRHVRFQDTSSEEETPEKVNKFEDVSEYNSNEMGSCRDCQNSEVNNVVMREVTQYQSNMEVETSISNNDFSALHYKQQDESSIANQAKEANDSVQRVMMFNDSDEEKVSDSSAIYAFTGEESSYSESSDCSSEGSVSYEEHNGYHNNYETFNADGTTTSGYCIPSTTVGYQSARSQQEQKYMDVNNSTNSMFKLEPISEILNPIRYSNYTTDGQSWSNNSESFYSYGSNGGMSNGNYGTSSGTRADTTQYPFPATDQTVPSQVHHVQSSHTPVLSQSAVNGCHSSNTNSTCLSQSNISTQYNDTSVTNQTFTESNSNGITTTYTNLNQVQSSTLTGYNMCPQTTSSTQPYHETTLTCLDNCSSTMGSTPNNNAPVEVNAKEGPVKLTSLSNVLVSSSSDPSKSARDSNFSHTLDNHNYSDSSLESGSIGLGCQSSVGGGDFQSGCGDYQAESGLGSSRMSDSSSDSAHSDGLPSSKSSFVDSSSDNFSPASPGAQDFGEIIKESIVETVSA
ncbi:unnamed protein product [Owenia fusiformis]|uniref:Cysteine/serine-rich nuclear protein N-terminal domain-containing protein n=1 Tax=Owenia fusiformis TaxID=6347 RepID=A0A8J1TRD3_OWEFU|nr:unnamed protein product [Owenia fusiformis]